MPPTPTRARSSSVVWASTDSSDSSSARWRRPVVFSSFWDRRYVLKEYDTEKRLLLEGIGPHSERIMFGTDHPAGSGTLEEIYRTLDRVGLGESVRERLVGGTAERFVKTFWPDFDSRNAKKA